MESRTAPLMRRVATKVHHFWIVDFEGAAHPAAHVPGYEWKNFCRQHKTLNRRITMTVVEQRVGAKPAPAAVERTALALIGNEEAVGAFLLAGWGQRRLSSSLECNWMCARESTPVAQIEAAWRAFVSSPQVAVLLVSAAVGRRIRDVTAEHKAEPTVVEIPGADTPPRVTCSVYEPYSGWQRGSEKELRERLALAFCAGGDASPVLSRPPPPPPHGTNPRVDALVAAVFRVATLGVSDDEEPPEAQRVEAGGKPGGPTPNAALNFKLQVLNAATTELAELLQSHHGPRDFVHALNRQRTRMVDVSAAFPFLAGLMLTVLDRCQSSRDVDSILTAMMLAQSFYRTRPDAAGREYLKAAIQSHPVWADVFFWREALALCVRKQRASYGESPRFRAAQADDPDRDQVLAPPPPPPDEAPNDDGPAYTSCLPAIFRFAAVMDSAERVALWSQLGGIVHAMLEFGTHPDVVRAFADAVCAEHDLSRQQRAIIVQHIETVRKSQLPDSEQAAADQRPTTDQPSCEDVQPDIVGHPPDATIAGQSPTLIVGASHV